MSNSGMTRSSSGPSGSRAVVSSAQSSYEAATSPESSPEDFRKIMKDLEARANTKYPSLKISGLLNPRKRILRNAIIDPIKEIDPMGDLWLLISEVEGPDAVFTTLRVNRQTLMTVSAYFKAMLGGNFWEATQNVVPLYEDDTQALITWMEILHGQVPTDPNVTEREDIEEMFERLYEVAKKYQLDRELLKPWFSNWFETQKTNFLLILATTANVNDVVDEDYVFALCNVCEDFDHYEGYRWATKILVYYIAINYIYYELRDRLGRLIGDKLRNIIFDLIDRVNTTFRSLTSFFDDSKCQCRIKASENIRDAINDVDLGIRPGPDGEVRVVIDESGEYRSIAQIMEELCQEFAYEADKYACDHCRRDPWWEVSKLRREIEDYFDGLCLDCVNRANKAAALPEEKRWEHAMEGHTTKACRHLPVVATEPQPTLLVDSRRSNTHIDVDIQHKETWTTKIIKAATNLAVTIGLKRKRGTEEVVEDPTAKRAKNLEERCLYKRFCDRFPLSDQNIATFAENLLWTMSNCPNSTDMDLWVYYLPTFMSVHGNMPPHDHPDFREDFYQKMETDVILQAESRFSGRILTAESIREAIRTDEILRGLFVDIVAGVFPFGLRSVGL